MNAHTWTEADALAAGPCSEYTPERIATLWAGREYLNAREVADLDIPHKDRIWALVRMAPREVWLPAIFAAVDRAVRVSAPKRLRAQGRVEDAEQLEALPQITDRATARSSASSAAAYAYYAPDITTLAYAVARLVHQPLLAAYYVYDAAADAAPYAERAADYQKTIEALVTCLMPLAGGKA